MNQSLEDIIELAEDLCNRFLSRGKVNLNKIAKSNGIRTIKRKYDNPFLGQLVHQSNKFYIVLNTSQLSKSEIGRVRFTIAHELGHYFIDAHRNKLKKGVSLSYNGDVNEAENKKIDTEANKFAANLLMPSNHFVEQANKIEPGLGGILKLKKKFETSIESTTSRYIDLNLFANVMIKWKPDLSFHYAWCSKYFAEMMSIRKSPFPIRFDSEYLNKQVGTLNSSNLAFIEDATPISRWMSTIRQGSGQDVVGLEQMVKLGDYGGIALLTFFV